MEYEYQHINVIDKDGQIIETFHNKQHMYDVLMNRYNALKLKREKEIKKAFNRGYWMGYVVAIITALIIDWIFN